MDHGTHLTPGNLVFKSTLGPQTAGWWLSPIKKYDFVNWDDAIPNISQYYPILVENKSHVPVTTDQFSPFLSQAFLEFLRQLLDFFTKSFGFPFQKAHTAELGVQVG